jgi:hypothetical protein
MTGLAIFASKERTVRTGDFPTREQNGPFQPDTVILWLRARDDCQGGSSRQTDQDQEFQAPSELTTE